MAQDPQFTQFYANPLYLNPAFAGTARCPRVVLNYRNQWPALDRHLRDHQCQLRPARGRAQRWAWAFLVTNDQAGKGTLNTTTVSGIYCYQQAISRKFSMKVGFQATYFQKSLDWSKLTFGDQIDPRRGFIYNTNDVPRGGSVGNADFSAGVLGLQRYVLRRLLRASPHRTERIPDRGHQQVAHEAHRSCRCRHSRGHERQVRRSPHPDLAQRTIPATSCVPSIEPRPVRGPWSDHRRCMVSHTRLPSSL